MQSYVLLCLKRLQGILRVLCFNAEALAPLLLSCKAGTLLAFFLLYPSCYILQHIMCVYIKIYIYMCVLIHTAHIHCIIECMYRMYRIHVTNTCIKLVVLIHTRQYAYIIYMHYMHNVMHVLCNKA